MPDLAPSDGDSAVRVVVTPSQSAYFAGEPFSVKVTFTNTRSPEAGPSNSASHGHKRGAHSISSAPLARPPTSPGTPRTPLASPLPRTKLHDDTPSRKLLIGRPRLPQGAEQLPELIEQRRKRLLAKSLSVTIAPHELEDQIAEGTLAKSASYVQRSFEDVHPITPTSPHVPSPLARTNILPSNHPHARKQSVFDGQFSLDVASPTTPVSSTPYSPNSSTSTFSLTLDPIAEGTLTPYTSTPSLTSPVIETPTTTTFPPSSPNLNSNTVYAYPPPQPRQGRRPPPTQLGLGQPSSQMRGNQPPKSAFSSTFPQQNVELILYSYAQITGSVSITPVPGTIPTPEQRQTLNSVRAALLKRSIIGGGSMDITSSLAQSPPPSARPRRPTHSRSSSFSSGLLSILSPTSIISPTSPSRWRSSSSSLTSPPPAGFPRSAGLTTTFDEEIDPEHPLPTFEVQPAMLAVDLSLLPGESRSYTYTILLPDNLPPTYRGKSLKFSYELVVGTCRAGSTSPGPGAAGANSNSRVMKVPIRVYNHVNVGQHPRSYDILWPVNKPRDRASIDMQAKVVEDTTKPKPGRSAAVVTSPLSSSPSAASETYEELQGYARRLVASLPDPKASGVRIKLPAEALSPSAQDNGDGRKWEDVQRTRAAEEVRRKEKEREREEEGGLTGCREAVEILTRNPKKASYDVNKDGVKVAVLTFTKSAYRLGETIGGVVELNERIGRTRVLQLSAILEAHETLPSTIAPPSSSRHLRRAHAEHYSYTLSTLRTTFALDIPSDASPAFQVRVGSSTPNSGGLEWKVRLCLLVAVAAESSHAGTEGVRMKGLVRDGARGEWGSPWRATGSLAPFEKPRIDVPQKSAPKTWGQLFTSTILGAGEREYHDGDDLEGEEGDSGYDGIKPEPGGGVGVGVDFGGGEEGWREVRLETVECEVPIKVWPGNTAFKALDVVFDV